MKLFKSRHFAVALQDLHESHASCDESKRRIADGSYRSTEFDLTGKVKPSDGFVETIKEQLNAMADVCQDAGFDNAKTKIALVLIHLNNNSHDLDYATLAADLRNVNDVVMTDFWKREFVEIPYEFTDLIDADELFGAQVKQSFPSSSRDILDAGNCIAVGLGTSAVFHLMRAVESGLRGLCTHLHILRIRKSKKPKQKKYIAMAYSQWEKMLDAVRTKIDTKINALSPGKRKQDLQEFYYPLLQDLRGFKDAWRNHVMHSRKEYTPKEADAILKHVRSFMQRLATRVSEPKVDYLADL
jgi:hypothetical protein